MPLFACACVRACVCMCVEELAYLGVGASMRGDLMVQGGNLSDVNGVEGGFSHWGNIIGQIAGRAVRFLGYVSFCLTMQRGNGEQLDGIMRRCS